MEGQPIETIIHESHPEGKDAKCDDSCVIEIPSWVNHIIMPHFAHRFLIEVNSLSGYINTKIESKGEHFKSKIICFKKSIDASNPAISIFVLFEIIDTGDKDAVTEGGEYIVEFILSKDYPTKASNIRFHTPNGVFVADGLALVCLNGLTGFHPESYKANTTLYKQLFIISMTIKYYNKDDKLTGIGISENSDLSSDNITAMIRRYARESKEFNKKVISKLLS